MIAVLTDLGVAVPMVPELEDRYSDLRFHPSGTAFFTDASIVRCRVELKGRLNRVMGAATRRSSTHSHELHLYEIDGDGIVLGRPDPDREALALLREPAESA